MTHLPDDAPVIVCGISVVTDRVVYASGTNGPTDSPRMMKTVDGGLTWTAMDMTAHASILIDTFFTDEIHGWVVGGKADVPNPTDRDRIKPVVLRTFDGGALGSIGWPARRRNFPSASGAGKSSFSADLGFVSLENFQAGAILKTTDGGLTGGGGDQRRAGQCQHRRDRLHR